MTLRSKIGAVERMTDLEVTQEVSRPAILGRLPVLRTVPAGLRETAGRELSQRTPTYYGTALGSVWLDGRPVPISPCTEGPNP